ncbi:MAG: 2OG-Fe(II) oxygenase [Cyanobacteria bacterium]|nr:2OG-Fe(II) oxygenase [Cyanobacteriota bacterium]
MLVDYDHLDNLAEAHAEQFRTAQPFPHIVIDNFLPEHVLTPLLQEFPLPDAPLAWRRHYVEPKPGQVAQANKLGFSDLTKLGPNIRQLFWEMNSARFLTAMEKLSGIDKLIGDPCLDGGGIHQSMRGAVLAMHADFSHHPVYKLDRRLNIILYLNPVWKDEWEGHLELWDRSMTQCVHRVAPILNRAVVFSTTQTSYHGHPQPLNTPDGITRKSMALYYYTNGRPEGENDGEHGTLWQRRPDETAKAVPKVDDQDFAPQTGDSSTLKRRLSDFASRLLR